MKTIDGSLLFCVIKLRTTPAGVALGHCLVAMDALKGNGPRPVPSLLRDIGPGLPLIRVLLQHIARAQAKSFKGHAVSFMRFHLLTQ